MSEKKFQNGILGTLYLSVRPLLRPKEITRLQKNGFSWNVHSENLPTNSAINKIYQVDLCSFILINI